VAHTYTIIGVLAEKKGTGLPAKKKPGRRCSHAYHALLEDYGEAKRTVNIATQAFTQDTYNRTFDRAIGAMRIARGFTPGATKRF